MKIVPLGKVGSFDTKSFLIEMMKTCPQGQNIGQMRERMMVLNALTAASDTATEVALEDSQHTTLLNVLNSRGDFVVTSADILSIADAVIAAKAPDK
jgi:hypothetical protein